MRVLLVVVLGFSTLLSAQSLKDKKLEEIDRRIAELQREIEGLQALKNVISLGQLPDSALNQIVLGTSAAAKSPAETQSFPLVSPGSQVAAPAQSPAPSSPGSAQAATAVRAPAATGTPTGQTTASGQPIYEGPRGGRYHYSPSGKKVYERKK
ncbi:MAG: hypothetical protein IT159_01710 [Bryobacterales bacterium]|nr:hypothetical protein [Bryobacterales bacterium]